MAGSDWPPPWFGAIQRKPAEMCPTCGQPIRTAPPRCVCGHIMTSHDLNAKGRRTKCFHIDGPRGRYCPCELFMEA